MKHFLFIIFFFNSALALEVKCNFEEVYGNKDIQQGLFLLKNDNLRYQYKDINLYTIFSQNQNFYIVQNNNKNVFRKIDDYNLELLKMIYSILNDFPEIKKEYTNNEFQIKIEKNNNQDFIKRIAIISSNLQLSLYINDCKFEKIEDIYFRYNPYQEYS